MRKRGRVKRVNMAIERNRKQKTLGVSMVASWNEERKTPQDETRSNINK